jgi:hypothetical protein
MAAALAEFALWIAIEVLIRAPGYALRKVFLRGRPVTRHFNNDANDLLVGIVLWVFVAIVSWLLLRG